MKPGRFAIAALALVVAVALGLSLWARSVLSGDAVRDAVAAQLTTALGAPVTIGGLGASVFPRVSMDLSDVSVGQPARLTIARLRVGTSLRALLSRRIEHADLSVLGARVELPLPHAIGAAGFPDETVNASAPVTLVSVDEITLAGIEVVSGGRSLLGNANLRWLAGSLAIDRATFAAGDASVLVTGEMSDMAGPVGTLKLTAADLDVLGLVDFLSAFAAGATAGAPAASGGPVPARTTNLAVAIDAGRATFGDLEIEGLLAHARVTADAIRLDPIDLRVFGGTVAGTLTFAMGPRPSVKLISSLQGVDVAAAMAFAGSPDTMTGRAAGRVDVEAVGVTAAEVVRTVSGTARFDVSDGTVRGLGLVRAVVLAGSMRAESQAQAAARKTTDGESFSRLGLSMTIANGVARTTDLQFESPDVLMNAAGVLALASVHVDLAGDVQLSDDLSKSAGRDLVRYTGEGGRATLPITVAGPVSDLRVRVDVTDAARRALENRAAEEAKKALSKVLGRIIK